MKILNRLFNKTIKLDKFKLKQIDDKKDNNFNTTELRDKYKNRDYFIRFISNCKKYINFYEKIIEEDKYKNISLEDKEKRINIWISSLSFYYRNLFSASYSIGENVENLYGYFFNWIKNYSERCYENKDILEIIDIFAIAVLYDNRKDELIPYLETIIEKTKAKDDGMVVFFANYLDIKLDGKITSKMKYYNILMDSTDKEAELRLAIKNWYNSHKDAAWYDFHKSKNNVYYGYWAFDLAALAKIFKLNDEDLKDNKYYPYDLVHYNK